MLQIEPIAQGTSVIFNLPWLPRAIGQPLVSGPDVYANYTGWATKRCYTKAAYRNMCYNKKIQQI